VLGWDPGLGQPALEQQIAQVAGVEAIGLGAPLSPAQAAGLGRLGQVRDGAGGAQLLDHEAPTGRRLKRRLDLLTVEPAQEVAQRPAVGGPDTPPADLAGLAVEGVEGDLLAVDVESHYDRHRGLLKLRL
jgi:hypothetical protein